MADNQQIYEAWKIIASARRQQGKPALQVLRAYRSMARTVEALRAEQLQWETRLSHSKDPASGLREAAMFAIHAEPPFVEDSFKFTVQSKARALGELLNHDPSQLRALLPPSERARLDSIERAATTLEMERHGWRRTPIVNRRRGNQTTGRPQTPNSLERARIWKEKKTELDHQRETLIQQVIINNPESEPFVLGPAPGKFGFSLAKLKRRLQSGEAVLESLLAEDGENKNLLGFLVTQDGLVKTHRWGQEWSIYGEDGSTLEEWHEQVRSVLHIGQRESAGYIGKDLTEDVLSRWSQSLYGPFIDSLSGIHRLWVSPHSFLTQLPFNAIPFPDGVERMVAVIPSAASLLRAKPSQTGSGLKFTLGVVAADVDAAKPLNLQSEEVRRLRGSVRSARHRWELAGNTPEEEPTLVNLQGQFGLTRCLVISCHGDGPDDEWGTLSLGTKDMPEVVTGRQLVHSFLLRGEPRKMEVSLLVTSACLTGQVDLERAEEWLGLPLALQAVWKTKAMLLTLWEVEELPAMIWVVELVKALTQGFSAGDALRLAQDKVRTVTREQVDASWLAEAYDWLSPERWARVDARWRETTRTTGQHPFSNPVHWAPFVLFGDPRVTISPRR